MSLIRQRPSRQLIVNNPAINNGPRKKNLETEPLAPFKGSNPGNLSPDLQPNTPPVFPKNCSQDQDVLKIGKYLLYNQTTDSSEVYNAVNSQTHEEFVCKVLPINTYRQELSPYWQVDCHENITNVSEIILGEAKAYVFFEKHFTDLHSYVRQKKRLREEEAAHLFKQIISAVQHCHDNGLILRDLKLRKFVFKDSDRKTLRLDGLEDATILDDEENDLMSDKHGCPAYVSPEILNATGTYSGKAADMWSLGVMLYTILIGRYPFHDTQPAALFGKIRRGQFNIPNMLSSRAKCLIKTLLRRDPSERLTAEQVLEHPWFKGSNSGYFSHRTDRTSSDQIVPEYIETCDDFFV
ncbi:hypothetical protein SNE40_006227 [Patella caerulea]|uniref:Protein kinase domain-containing protein n=1 Tax=Patella caerulea TaxID=87958 RepID=A0AAN8PVU7_PATCE